METKQSCSTNGPYLRLIQVLGANKPDNVKTMELSKIAPKKLYNIYPENIEKERNPIVKACCLLCYECKTWDKYDGKEGAKR